MIHSLLSSLPNISDGEEPDHGLNAMLHSSAFVGHAQAHLDLTTEKIVETDHTEPLLSIAALESAAIVAGTNGFSPQEMQEEGLHQEKAELEAIYVRVDNHLSLDEELPANSNITGMTDKNTNLQVMCETTIVSVCDPPVYEPPVVPNNERDPQTTAPAADETEDNNQMLPSRDDDILPDNCPKFPAGDEALLIHASPAEIQPDELENPQSEIFVSQEVDSKPKKPEEIAPKDYSKSTLLLTDLLKLADALYAEFPPSHVGLHLSSIMGPQSVIFTWSESFSDLPSDEEAESMVQHPELIVYPHVESEEEDSPIDEMEPSRRRWILRRRKGKEKVNSDKAKTKKRRQAFKSLSHSHPEKRTVIAGAVLMVGMAVAIYGIHTRSGSNNGLFFSHSPSGRAKIWQSVSDWVARTLMNEK
jgi:hypothetical protein